MKNEPIQNNDPGGFQSDSSARRIMTNGVFTAVRFGVYMLASFLFIPYLISRYGDGPYGLIALAGWLTMLVGLVQRCVGNAVARFLNIALNQHDWKQANEIYSTAMMANAGFILVQIPLLVLAVWKLDVLISFPAERALDFKILVICNIIIFFATILTGVLSTPIQAANRLDITTTLDTAKIILRVLLLIPMIEILGAKLWIIGAVDLLLALLNALFVGIQGHKLAPELAFRLRYVTRRWVRPVMNMAGWSVVTAIGGYTFIKTDIWMINRFVDDAAAGVYAALLVWPNFLRQISKQLASILAPVYMIDYARGDVKRVARMSLSSAKLLACLVGCCVGGICVLAEPVLALWLDESYTVYAPLLQMMVIYLTFTIGEAVLWQIYTTINKVHFVGIVSLIAGGLNIMLSLGFIWAGFGAMGVAVGTALAQVFSSTFAVPIGVCREFRMPLRTVWWNHLSAGLFLLVSYAATWISWDIFQKNWIGGILCFVPLMGGGLFFAARWALSADERDLLGRLIGKLLRRVAPAAAGRRDG